MSLIQHPSAQSFQCMTSAVRKPRIPTVHGSNSLFVIDKILRRHYSCKLEMVVETEVNEIIANCPFVFHLRENFIVKDFFMRALG